VVDLMAALKQSLGETKATKAKAARKRSAR
jgi:non-homologous end joining protein Ku